MTLVAINAALALVLVGLIWTVQLVHYPLMARVGTAAFPAYHAEHSRRITWLVAPLMGLELLAALAMVLTRDAVDARVWASAALVGVVWVSTACVQVPLHRRLARDGDRRALGWLVRSNWIRTGAWTARAAILLSLA